MQLALYFAALFTAAVAGVDACGDDQAHDHDHSRREYPQTVLPAPTRPLQWGDVNIIHTTVSSFRYDQLNISLCACVAYSIVDLGRIVMAGFWDTRSRRGRSPTTGSGPILVIFKRSADDYICSSGDFGDFASFVKHMKEIAEVAGPSFYSPSTF